VSTGKETLEGIKHCQKARPHSQEAWAPFHTFTANRSATGVKNGSHGRKIKGKVGEKCDQSKKDQ